MAVNFFKIPKGQVFAKSPIRFGVESNNYVVSERVRPYLIVNFSSPGPNDADQILIQVGGVGIFIGFSNTPPTNEAQEQQTYKRAVGNYLIFSQWIDYLEAALNNNFLLKSYFDITRSGTSLQFTGKTDAPITPIVFAANTTSFLNNTAAPAQYRLNYLMLMDVFVEKTYRQGDFEFVATIEHEPDSNKQAWFDVAPFVLPYLGADLPPVTTTGIAAGLCTQMQKRYNVAIKEQSGSPVVTSTVVQATHTRGGYAQRGGFSFLGFNKDYSLYKNQSSTSIAFMSWGNVPKPTLTNQPEYLFFRKMATNVARVKLVLTYQDGTTDTFNNHCSSIDFAQFAINDIVWLSAGYSQLGIDGVKNANKKVSKYSLQLTNSSNNGLYAPFVFEVDHRHYIYQLPLLYQNSWGAMETLMLKGNVKRRLQTENTDFTRTLGVGYDALEGESNTFDERSREGLEVVTGYYRRSYIEYLRDMLNNNRYLYIIEGGQYVKVNVEAGNVDISEDEQDLYFMPLKLRYAHSNHSFTNLQQLPEATQPYTVPGGSSNIILLP
jgi:hypothetical protein